MLKIGKTRKGFATNSSSSHSVVYGKVYENSNNVCEYDYGWEYFILKDKEEKIPYLLTQIKYNYKQYDDIMNWVHDKFIEHFNDDEYEIFRDSYIDHESVIKLPIIENDGQRLLYVEEWLNFLLDDNFVILGGNDNSDYSVRVDKYTNSEQLVFLYNLGENYTNYKVYRNGNYWVGFNIENGDKIQFAFTSDRSFEFKPQYPELIDIKITNYCDIGCTFCYQNSTTKGKHANIDNIRKIVNKMSDININCEFAIGGGEPSRHPDFVNILNILKNDGKNIVNVTTNDIDSMVYNKEIFDSIVRNVSAIGLSISNMSGVDDRLFYNIMRFLDKGVKIVFHIIPDLFEHENDVLDLLSSVNTLIKKFNKKQRWCSDTYDTVVLFLGYKTTGRANKNFEKLSFYNIFKEIDKNKKFKRFQISIDTKYANDHLVEIRLCNIDKTKYYLEEGKYSLYYDAVKDKYYKSSYQLKHKKYYLKDALN